MRQHFATLAVLALAACTPPEAAEEPSATTATAPEAAAPETAATDVDRGPYANTWDAAEFSRFRHTLHAPSAGPREITLRAESNAPGGETVAIYPLDSAGQRMGSRILFVVATRAGAEETATVEFPANDAGAPVEVVVENAGGRAHQGSYTITVAP